VQRCLLGKKRPRMELVEATPVGAADDVVKVATAVPVFPPRPDAIVTLITSDDQLAGAQTLMYSIKKNNKSIPKYPPELVVLATPNVSIQRIEDALIPDFCTRVTPVPTHGFPSNSKQHQIHPAASSQAGGESGVGDLTLINVFGLCEYDTVVYIGVNCLVVKDVHDLLDLGKVYTISDALIAAAPDIVPPDKFNCGVMVIRPDDQTHAALIAQRGELVSHDGCVGGYLNAYFPNWFRDMPPMARLGVEYNAQTMLYDLAARNAAVDAGDGDDTNAMASFWEVHVASKLCIIQYSNYNGMGQPWKIPSGAKDDRPQKVHPLTALWRTWNRKSMNYQARVIKERKDDERKMAQQQQQQQQQDRKRQAQTAAPTSAAPNDPKRLHKLISRRFKELRSQGVPSKEAMVQAQAQYQDQQTHMDAGSQVAAMFGMR